MNSVFSPDKKDFETRDGLEVAKDIAWVIKTLWSGGVIFMLCAVWVIALAQDVKTNAAKVADAATKEQMQLVLSGIKDIKGSLVDADKRQRDIQRQVDKLEQQVEDVKKRDE